MGKDGEKRSSGCLSVNGNRKGTILLITLTNQVDRLCAWSSRTPLTRPLLFVPLPYFYIFVCFALDLCHLFYALIPVFQAGEHCFECQMHCKSLDPKEHRVPGHSFGMAEMMNRVVKKTRCRVPLVLLFIPWFRSVSDEKKLSFVSQRNQLRILI